MKSVRNLYGASRHFHSERIRACIILALVFSRMHFTPTHCPHPDCKYHFLEGGNFIKKSFYKVKRLNQYIRRFQCCNCKRTFSSRTLKSDYRHKKMDLNAKLQKLLTEGNSIRASSRILGMTYKNTFNKFLWLMREAKKKKEIQKYYIQTLYFDEMETIHHTKCKPLSIALAVNEKYQILGMQVAEMPAKGRLAEFSVRKYGPRQDDREKALESLFEQVKAGALSMPALIKSDQKSSYQKFVERYFPRVVYETHSRAEKERHREKLHERLHKRKYDPMFVLNQRCAKLRSDIRRLTRRSWCTTKRLENLQGHLDIYLMSQLS